MIEDMTLAGLAQGEPRRLVPTVPTCFDSPVGTLFPSELKTELFAAPCMEMPHAPLMVPAA